MKSHQKLKIVAPNNFSKPVADPETSERGGGGARNMNYKPLRSAAIFVWPIFTGRGGGAWPPWPPPLDPLLWTEKWDIPSGAYQLLDILP